MLTAVHFSFCKKHTLSLDVLSTLSWIMFAIVYSGPEGGGTTALHSNYPGIPRGCSIIIDSTNSSSLAPAKTFACTKAQFGSELYGKKKDMSIFMYLLQPRGHKHISTSSAMRSSRLWERGCREHGKMWRNVIPGQCEAWNSAVPLGTRPQAVCFCRDTLNCPCTYVNIEHEDTRTLKAQ